MRTNKHRQNHTETDADDRLTHATTVGVSYDHWQHTQAYQCLIHCRDIKNLNLNFLQDIRNTGKELDAYVITVDIVQECIKKLQKGKAPGTDDLTSEHYPLCASIC